MGKQKTQDKPFKPSDYNDPTEPLVLPAYGSPASIPDEVMVPTVPAAAFYPSSAAPVYPYHQPFPGEYPALPQPRGRKHRGIPPGGAPYPQEAAPARRRRHSRWPGLVRLGFIVVQVILLANVVCMLFGVQNTVLWLTLLFVAGDTFVWPVRWLAANINLSSAVSGLPFFIYLEYLVAVLVYGLCSRLLTFLLRALLK